MTNKEILDIAMQQSAIDCSCTPEDFTKSHPVTVISRENPDARRYLTLPFSCQLVSYGNNIVASVSEAFYGIAAKYIQKFPPEHCSETPNFHYLNDELQKSGQRICFMAEYFLPDVGKLRVLDCPSPTRLFGPKDFTALYLPQWSNALCETRKHLDVLGVGAYDGDKLIGFAGCSADCDTMWQLGIDLLLEYRRRGIASALTSRLAAEILERGKVPLYCAA